MLLEGLFAGPAWLQIWVAWLIVANSAAVLFLREKPARWVLAAWLANLVVMTALAELSGFNRLLGLSHVLVWTPLLIYLYRLGRRGDGFSGASRYERWIRTLFVTDLLSLVVDYLDVARYLVGSE